MTEYGLPSARDGDGERKPVDHTYEFGGEEVTIRLIPPTIDEQEEYENLGMEAGADDLWEIVDDHLVKPEIEGTPTTREIMCYIEGIMDYSTGGGTVNQEIRQELEKRGQSPGN